MLKHLASWSIAAGLLGLMAGEARPLQAVNAPPRKHAQDPHQMSMNGATWFPAGYYPGLGAFQQENPDPGYATTLLDRLAANGINYMRNSVKVVIDAYDGSVTAYQADVADPLVRTFAKIFPGIFHPLDSMPADLRAHLRYPEDLFHIQTELYGTYHMAEPDIFYHR